jgi:hypothetical protein
MNYKKRIKLITIIIMIISVLGIVFTVLYVKNKMTNNSFNNAQPNMEQKTKGDNPPDMPSDESGNTEDKPSDNEDANGNGDTNNNQSPEQNMNQEFIEQNGIGQNEKKQSNSLGTTYIIIIGIFACTFSLSCLYLIMSQNNEKFYQNHDKLIIYILSNIILIECLTAATTMFTNKVLLKNNTFIAESQEKESVDLDEDIDVSDENSD